MNQPGTRHLVFVGPPGELPDSWTEVINELPPTVKAWLPRISGDPVGTIEALLDKQELRKVDVVAYGAGALAACMFVARQPHRVATVVLVDPELGMDERSQKNARRALRWTPGFLLRRRGLDKQHLLDSLDKAAAEVASVAAPVIILGESARARAAAEVLGVDPRAGGADYRSAAPEFVAEVLGALESRE